MTAARKKATKRKGPNTYVEGVLDAQIALAEIVGPMKMAELTPQTWDLVCKLNVRLCELALHRIDGESVNTAKEGRENG